MSYLGSQQSPHRRRDPVEITCRQTYCIDVRQELFEGLQRKHFRDSLIRSQLARL